MILPVLCSLMKQNGFFFSNPPTASTWLCFHGPFLLSFCRGFPTSQASLPMERGDLALGDPLGGPQSSACHGLCLSLQKVSYCLHTPTPGAPWGNGGWAGLVLSQGMGREIRGRKGAAQLEGYFGFKPPQAGSAIFSHLPLCCVLRASHVPCVRDGLCLTLPLFLFTAVSLPRMCYPFSPPSPVLPPLKAKNSSFKISFHFGTWLTPQPPRLPQPLSVPPPPHQGHLPALPGEWPPHFLHCFPTLGGVT